MSKPDVDVRALANLARMDVPDDELQKLQEELPAILAFVETVSSVKTSQTEQSPGLRNVMRDDTEPHESGMYTEKLLEQAPFRRENRLAVKQVISRKK
ncbi:aspartyl/glutamyl-tRNA amidotransferase subunit C [Candidatus Parcubacteria bacterium]|nr:MAG: aspartyl/glutamyl-tRNA amidotransferase subunit C [Candidatus Parcubacteria bacterium]